MRTLCLVLAWSFSSVAFAQEPEPDAPIVVTPLPVCLPPAICVLPVAPPATAPPPVEYAPPPAYAPPEYAPPQPPYVPPPAYAPPPVSLTLPAPNLRSNFVLVERTRPRLSVLGTGLGVFFVAWAIPAIVAADIGYGNLAIPFAGPILAMQDCSSHGCVIADYYLGLLLAHQLIGAVAAIVGAVTTEKVGRWVPRVTPIASRGITGLALTARF